MDYIIIPDEVDETQAKVEECYTKRTNMILFTGGTGLLSRNVTPEALKPILDRKIPGIEEAI